MQNQIDAGKQQSSHAAQPARGREVVDSAAVHPVFQLQQQAGNQAMQELLRAGVIRAKLAAISSPDDPKEREADDVAQTIMRKHDGFPAAHCSCGGDGEMCEECAQKSQGAIHRSAGAAKAPAHVPGIVRNVLLSSGRPLDASTRSFFEPRFGQDFSDVRIHTDPEAAESARSIHAQAYTLGRDIAFAAGRYEPNTEQGKGLIAHELVHTVQQSRTDGARIARSPDGAHNSENDVVALYPFKQGPESHLKRWIESESRTVGDVYRPPLLHDFGEWYVNGAALRTQLTTLNGGLPLTTFEEGLISTWDERRDSPTLTPYIQIGSRGVLGYSLVAGSSGQFFISLYDRLGNLLHQTSDEVPIQSEGLGPIDYFLLGRGLLQLARAAVGKFLAKRAIAAEIKAVASGSSPQFAYATTESWTYAGREIRIVRTPTRVRAFYRRTGWGRSGPLGPQSGDWAPFRGFGPGGRLMKAAEIHNEVEFPASRSLSEFGFEDEEGTLVNSWLRTEAEPLTPVEVGEAWGQIQQALRRVGVDLAFPNL